MGKFKVCFVSLYSRTAQTGGHGSVTSTEERQNRLFSCFNWRRGTATRGNSMSDLSQYPILNSKLMMIRTPLTWLNTKTKKQEVCNGVENLIVLNFRDQ